jgi:ribose transport system substrate-binding protein
MSIRSKCSVTPISLLLGACAREPTELVLYIVPSFDDEAYVVQLEAAREQAKKHPAIKFKFTAGTSRDVAPEFIAKIESGVARGVKVIVIDAGGSAEQLAPALRKAREAGVHVVLNAHAVPGVDADTLIRADHRAGAVPAGKFMATHLAPGDSIAVLRCHAGNAGMDARLAGFTDGLASSGIRIVASGETHCDPAEARKLMENWITAHPELKGVFSDTDIALMGALEAMRAAQRDLVVVGHDGQTPALRMLAAGQIIDATVVYPAGKLGVLAVDTAARILAGDPVPPLVVLPVEGLITRENVQDHLPHG